MTPEPVPVERVRGRVRRAAPAPPERDEADEAAVPAPQIAEHRPLAPGDAVPVATVGLVGVLSGEIVISVLAGVAALGALALRRLAIRERFGFGDGFTPFRSDMGWPRGVQEDDDFHWSWTVQQDEAAATGRRSIAR